MKEMIYKPKSEFDILCEETYRGFDFKIVSFGTHPCCYVAIRPELSIYKVNYDNDKIYIDCHGGLTFSDFRDFGDGEKWYIGWDYHHLGDYSGIYELEFMKDFRKRNEHYKKWTTEEMREECIYVIEEILKEEK